MDEQLYPDPLNDAAQHGLHRVVQIAACAGTAAQMYVHQQRTQARAVAERDTQARRVLQAQMRAERDAARTGWAPALDPRWLRHATLVDTARVWGAAMPYADRSVPWYEPTAATALRKSEERLRELHPHAMARYDRLRGDGLNPAEAMRGAAPLFARPARVYDGPSVPRPSLTSRPGTEHESAHVARPWENDFPVPIADVVAAASRPTAEAVPQAAAPGSVPPQPARTTAPGKPASSGPTRP
jgi:hypothetical protein